MKPKSRSYLGWKDFWIFRCKELVMATKGNTI